MKQRPLANDEDLLQFLYDLRQELALPGQVHQLDVIDRASRFYGGSTTEFLGEARIALRTVRNSVACHLDSEWLEQTDSVIEQINAAFRSVEG